MGDIISCSRLVDPIRATKCSPDYNLGGKTFDDDIVPSRQDKESLKFDERSPNEGDERETCRLIPTQLEEFGQQLRGAYVYGHLRRESRFILSQGNKLNITGNSLQTACRALLNSLCLI